MENTSSSVGGYRSRQPLVTLIILLLSIGGVVAALVLPGTTLLRVYTWDSLAFVDAGYRMANGEIPHNDFHFPLGFLCYALPYWGLLLTGAPAGAMPMALALALLILTPFLLYVLVTRLHWFIALPVGWYLLLLIGGPLNLGEVSERVSMGMYYNRLGWAALTLLMLTYIEPVKINRTSSTLDGLACGAALLFMLYLKVTYAFVGAAFLALTFALRQDRRLSVMIGFALMLAGAVGLEAVYHLHWGYYQDVLTALATSGAVQHGGPAGSPAHLVLSLGYPLSLNIQDLTLAVLALVLLALYGLLPLKDLLVSLYVLGSGILIINQNSQVRGLATIVFILVLCAERLARKNDAAGHRLAWPDLYPSLALLVAFVVLPITHQVLALARHAAVAWRTADPIVAMPRELDGFVIEDPGLGQLLASPEGEAIGEAIRDSNFEALRHYLPPLQEIFQVEYLVTVKDGIETLQRLAPAGKSVIVLDFSNPFSFSLRLPPPRGDALFNDIGRTQSRDHPIPAEAYFASATFVMIPHVPISVSARDYLVSTYADYIAHYFRPVVESRYWTVLRRQVAAS